MNPFELAFLGLILFDCRDQQLVEETLASVKDEEDRLEVMSLYEDLRRWFGKGFSISLKHAFIEGEPGAWLVVDTGHLPIGFLSPEQGAVVDDLHEYTKDEAWEKMSLWASMGPWDLMQPVTTKDIHDMMDVLEGEDECET